MAYASRAWVSSSIESSGSVTSPIASGPFPAAESSAQSFSGYPVFTEEQYYALFQQPSRKTVISITPQLPHAYAMNSSSASPPHNHGVSEEATLSRRSQSLNPPLRVIAPMPRRAFFPHAMLTTAAVLSSSLNQQYNSSPSCWQPASSTSGLPNASGYPGELISGQGGVDGTYSAPGKQ